MLTQTNWTLILFPFPHVFHILLRCCVDFIFSCSLRTLPPSSSSSSSCNSLCILRIVRLCSIFLCYFCGQNIGLALLRVGFWDKSSVMHKMCEYIVPGNSKCGLTNVYNNSNSNNHRQYKKQTPKALFFERSTANKGI